jgi:hypothetical protein
LLRDVPTATIPGTADVVTLAPPSFGDSGPMRRAGMTEFRRAFYIIGALWAACVFGLAILLVLRQ